MGRIAAVFLFALLTGVGALAESYYFTRSEKALMALSLKFYLSLKNGKESMEADQFKRHRESVLKQMLVEPEVITVQSYKEFLELVARDPHFVDEKLEQQKSSSLFGLLRPVIYVSSSARVQRKINLYFEKRIEFFKRLVASSPHGLEKLIETISKTNDLPTIKEKVQRIYDQKVNELVRELRQSDSIHITY